MISIENNRKQIGKINIVSNYFARQGHNTKILVLWKFYENRFRRLHDAEIPKCKVSSIVNSFFQFKVSPRSKFQNVPWENRNIAKLL